MLWPLGDVPPRLEQTNLILGRETIPPSVKQSLSMNVCRFSMHYLTLVNVRLVLFMMVCRDRLAWKEGDAVWITRFRYTSAFSEQEFSAGPFYHPSTMVPHLFYYLLYTDF